MGLLRHEERKCGQHIHEGSNIQELSVGDGICHDASPCVHLYMFFVSS